MAEAHAGLNPMYSMGHTLSRGGGDMLFEIAKGNFAGHSVVNKFGRNPDIDTATVPEAIWDGGGLNTQPTENRVHSIESTSTADAGTLVSSGTATAGSINTLEDSAATFVTDGVAVGDVILMDDLQDHSIITVVDSETKLTYIAVHHGIPVSEGETYRVATAASTGAVVLHIKLAYQEDGTGISEFVILNGTTAVNTTNSLYRINRMHIHGVGSGGKNAGTISATAATDATITAQINPGNGQTLMAITHIPMGYTGYITHYYANIFRASKISDAMIRVVMKSRLWGSTDDGELFEHTLGVGIAGGRHSFSPFKRISQGTDVWMEVVECTDDNTDVSAGFDLILVKNT